MKHFANFAPSYNNIGLGVGAAIGLAKGSGLIGESQEERNSTTGLGRLGKIAGYTGGGAALGAGAGMAVNAGTKYLQGRKGSVPEPRPQDRTTAAEPWDDNWTKPQPQRPEPVTPPPDKRAMGVSARVSQKKAANTSPYAPPQSKASTVGGRAATWNGAGYKQHRAEIQTKINEIKASALPEEQKKSNIKFLLKELEYKTLNNPVLVDGKSVQDLINAGNYSKSQTNTKNF
jgi:hypothetical protein